MSHAVDYGNKITQYVLKVWHNLQAVSAQWKVAAKSKEEEEGGQKVCSKDDC